MKSYQAILTYTCLLLKYCNQVRCFYNIVIFVSILFLILLLAIYNLSNSLLIINILNRKCIISKKDITISVKYRYGDKRKFTKKTYINYKHCILNCHLFNTFQPG